MSYKNKVWQHIQLRATFFCYKRLCRDNFLAECVISHYRKGICVLTAKEDSHYLTPMTNVVCFGTVNAFTQEWRTGSPFASFWKAVLPTPKIGDVISEPDMEWMNNSWKHMSCPIISFRRYTSKLESAWGLQMLLPSPCVYEIQWALSCVEMSPLPSLLFPNMHHRTCSLTTWHSLSLSSPLIIGIILCLVVSLDKSSSSCLNNLSQQWSWQPYVYCVLFSDACRI